MESSIESTTKGINLINDKVAKDPKLQSVLNNPVLSKNDRNLVVDALLKENGLTGDKQIKNFLLVVAENNRLSSLNLICQQYNKLNDAFKGIVHGNVITREKLDDKSFKKLEKAIMQSKFISNGKSLQLTNLVRPEIKGGLIVEIDDKTVDLSIATKIQNLNKVLQESI